MLEYNKRHRLVTAIKETNKDPKQLFMALNSILGNKNENQLPKGTTNSQLAEDFTDFFLEKNRQDKERVHQLTSISTKWEGYTKNEEFYNNNPKPTRKKQ